MRILAALAVLGSLVAAKSALAIVLRRSAFIGAGRVGDRTISGVIIVGDPVASVSEGGARTLWHGFLGPLGLVSSSVAIMSAADLALVPPSPNPVASELAIRFHVAGGRTAAISVFDLGGRRVRRFSETTAQGESTIFWSLDRDGGARLPSGIYFIRLEADHQCVVRPVMIVD